jgi:hypothetical protein
MGSGSTTTGGCATGGDTYSVVVVVSGTVEVVVDVDVVDCSGMVGSGASDVLVGAEEVVVSGSVVVTGSVTGTVVVGTVVVLVVVDVVDVVVNSHIERLPIER